MGWIYRDHWGHVQSRNRMSLACLQQTQRKLPSTLHVLLSTHPNTSTPIGMLWVEVCSRAWWRELLNCSFQGQKMQRWTWTHLSSSWCRQHPPTSVHGRDLQGLQRGGAACRFGMGNPAPVTVPWNNTATQGLGFLLFFRGSKELFLYPSYSLWIVSKTWEVS